MSGWAWALRMPLHMPLRSLCVLLLLSMPPPAPSCFLSSPEMA